jgi:hypothetical protein
MLNRAGFQPIFLPYTGIRPPELYNFARRAVGPRLVRRGPLADYLPASAELPVVKAELPDITHQHTTAKRMSAATDFLAKALACLGIAALPAIDLGFAGSAKLVFTLRDVHSLRVEPSLLDRTIQQLDLDAIPAEYLDLGFLHIAYEYAYARSIVLRRQDAQALHTGVKGDVASLIDLGAEVEVSAEDHYSLRFSARHGREVPAFAYRAGRLQRDSRWRFYPMEIRRSATDETPTPYLLRRGIVLDVE